MGHMTHLTIYQRTVSLPYMYLYCTALARVQIKKYHFVQAGMSNGCTILVLLCSVRV
jgi:hypothetical protein